MVSRMTANIPRIQPLVNRQNPRRAAEEIIATGDSRNFLSNLHLLQTL